MGLLNSFNEYLELARLQSRLAKHFPSFAEQKKWLKQLKQIDDKIQSAHNQSHILKFLLEILDLPGSIEGNIVEAGAFKGGSTAKISLFAACKKRQLHVFDSFEGLPLNAELHEKSTEGHSIKGWFEKGNFSGSLEEVQKNVAEFGSPGVVIYHKGWFENTMPFFNDKIALVYLDVDLAQSTRTCLKYLFPLLQLGGAVISQDGDFPLVVEVFKDEKFWKEEVGCPNIPAIEGLGKKITIIRKK